MPKKSYPLEPGSTQTVDLAWRGLWKDFTVSVGGRELGRMNGQDELSRGASWTLDDGSQLQVILAKSAMSAELQVTRNGVPVPGSPSDPKSQLSGAFGILAFIGGLNTILGILAALVEVPFLVQLGLGWGSLIFGVILIGLGLAVRKGSRIALIVAIVLFALDGLLGLYFVIDAGGQPGVGGIVFRVFILVALIKAVGAAKPEHGAM